MRRPLGAILVLALLASPAPTRGDGDAPADGPATVFERFVLSACSPCVRESYPIAILPIAPLPLPGFPRSATTNVALRVTLSVSTGTGGDLFRLGTGLLDGADVRALAQAVGEMARIATAPPGEPRAETVDADFHGGTLRIGVLQIRGDAVGYIQTGDLPILLQRAVWEVPTTLYVPVKDLPAVAAALGQAAARIDQVRGN